MKRTTRALAVSLTFAGMCLTGLPVTAQKLYDHPTFDQFERAIAAAEGRPYVPSPARKTDPTFDQMERLIRAIEDGGAATNSVTLAAFDYATNMLAQVKRDKDDLAVYRKVKDIWKWENWRHEDADADAPADFLAAANSPGAYPLAYRAETGSWMYANQYWPNGNVKYDSQMPPGGHEGALSTNLLFKFRAFPESGGTNVLFSFGAKASRASATDETIVDWEKDGPQHVAPVRIATTDLVGIELEHKVSRDDLAAATNSLRRVDGAARPLPKYLHTLDFASSYPEAAAEYYSQRLDHGGCSAVRDGGFLYRNFDFPFDDRAEFVVRMRGGKGRFASVGVAQVGTNLTEDIVTSGKWSKWYKALPGATVDGINDNGVCAEINVVSTNGVENWHGDPGADGIHCLGAVRWVLDNATSAGMAASNLASRVYVPDGMGNFHYVIADERETWIVENGHLAYFAGRVEVTNFLTLVPNEDFPGEWEFSPASVLDEYTTIKCPGAERWIRLAFYPYPNVTNVWYTNAYRRETNPPWVSDLADVLDHTNEIFNAWASYPKEYFRGKTNNGIPWWQTVHTSVYDLTNRVLRIAVQETDDWYVFKVPVSGTDEGAVREIAEAVVAPVRAAAAQALDDADAANANALMAQGAADAAKALAQAAQAAADAAQETADSKIDSEEATAIAVSEVEQGIDNYDTNVVYPALELKADRNGSSIEDFEAKDINSSGTLSVGEVLCGGEVHADGNISSVQSIAAEGDVYAGGYGGVSLKSVAYMLDAKAERSMISADDATFSAAVLAVGLNIDAETLQWLKDIGAIAGTTTGKVGIGTLLTALLAALMWLKRNKADKSELPYMTDLGDGRYEYTGAVVDAETRTYPGEVA